LRWQTLSKISKELLTILPYFTIQKTTGSSRSKITETLETCNAKPGLLTPLWISLKNFDASLPAQATMVVGPPEHTGFSLLMKLIRINHKQTVHRKDFEI